VTIHQYRMKTKDVCK